MDPLRKLVEARPGRYGTGVELARAKRLQERLAERAADPHRLTHRLHLRPEGPVGTGKLLEREARRLDDHVVESWLEARRSRPGQVVRDLVERVADRELGRDLRDRVPGRLRRERRRPGDARVELDHAHVAALAIARKLDVRAAALDADRSDHRSRCVAQLLVGLVREGHLRGDRDGVARVDAHRVEVLDRADDDHVVRPVPDQLELELVPADQALLDQHLADRALCERPRQQLVQLAARARDTAPVAAEREGRAKDHREREVGGHLGERRDDQRLGHLQPGRPNGVAEFLAVLGAADDVGRRADQLDPERVEHTRVGQLEADVERGLAAHRRQQRVRPLAPEHVRDALHVERLEVGAVGEAGVGHDRGRVRVDDDRAEAVLAEHLQRLAARVVELAGLADDDRAGADQADRAKITPPGQAPPPRPTR